MVCETKERKPVGVKDTEGRTTRGQREAEVHPFADEDELKRG